MINIVIEHLHNFFFVWNLCDNWLSSDGVQFYHKLRLTRITLEIQGKINTLYIIENIYIKD